MNLESDKSLAPHASQVVGRWTVWLGKSTGSRQNWAVSLETQDCYFSFCVGDLAVLRRVTDQVDDWIAKDSCGSMELNDSDPLSVEIFRDACSRHFHMAMPSIGRTKGTQSVHLKFDQESIREVMDAFRALIHRLS